MDKKCTKNMHGVAVDKVVSTIKKMASDAENGPWASVSEKCVNGVIELSFEQVNRDYDMSLPDVLGAEKVFYIANTGNFEDDSTAIVAIYRVGEGVMVHLDFFWPQYSDDDGDAYGVFRITTGCGPELLNQSIEHAVADASREAIRSVAMLAWKHPSVYARVLAEEMAYLDKAEV